MKVFTNHEAQGGRGRRLRARARARRRPRNACEDGGWYLFDGRMNAEYTHGVQRAPTPIPGLYRVSVPIWLYARRS